MHLYLLYPLCLDVRSNGSNRLNETSSTEVFVLFFSEFWRRYLRKIWHYIVVPPLIATAKRLQREEVSREENNNNNPKKEENEEEFHIDYKRATIEFFQRLFTEFIGTFLLTSVSSGLLVEVRLLLINLESAAFATGLTKLFLIYTLGGISGAHLNPVITIGFTLRRVFPWTWVPFYFLVQFVGAIIGGLLVRALFGGQHAALGTNSLDTSISSLLYGFKWEIFLTFCLVFVVLQTATKASIIGSQAAISVGAVIAVASQIGQPNSLPSMNPWRTLGPSIINNSPDDRHSLWVYIAGPFLGGLVAYLVVSLIHGFGTKRNEITSAHGSQLNNETVEVVTRNQHFQ